MDINLKIVYEDDRGLTQNSTKYLEVSKLSSYDAFIDLLNKTMTLDSTLNYLIFLKDQNGEKLLLDKNSFDNLKERVFARKSEDEVYLLLRLREEFKKSLNSSQQILNDETNKALEDYWTSKVKPFLDPLISSMLYEKPTNSVIIILILIGSIYDRKLG